MGSSWIDQFNEDGYAVIESFLTEQECDELRTEMRHIVDGLDIENEHRAIFNTRDSNQASDDYFLTSGDKIRYFFEKGAFKDDGSLAVPKQNSLNKVGHALHWWNKTFKATSFSPKVQELAREIGLVDPAIIQSMYIFKNPRLGAEVCPHQDASFLYMDPLKLYGIWIALDDATEENGCLWFIPGSHKTDELMGDRRMVRKSKEDGSETLELLGEIPNPDQSLYKAAPVKKGSLVVIHGMVLHKSEPNTSEKPRNAYTLHFIDQKDAVWSDKNWLQPTQELPFTPLFTTEVD